MLRGRLLTGHTMDDQAETVAMRMQTDLDGASLAGVWRERDWNGIMLYRPLLEHETGSAAALPRR